MSLEYCIECDQETGNAGIGDDSLYLEDGRGPYCDCCYYKNRVEELETEIERLRDDVKELTEDNTTLYNECEDAIVRAEKAEEEIERLRRVEQAARGLIDAYPFSLPAYTPYSTKWAALKEALEEK